MAEVIYIGPHDAVDVPAELGGWQTVAKGDTLNTSDEHAASLLEQPANWAPKSAEKPKSDSKVKNESKPDDGGEA